VDRANIPPVGEAFELSSESTCAAIQKTAESYRLPHGRATTFRRYGSVPVKSRDIRILGDSVRIALARNPLTIQFQCRPSDRAHLVDHGEARIGVSRNGEIFMTVAVEIETPESIAQDVFGIDLGVTNIATDSDGRRYSGAALRGIRYRRRRLREATRCRG